MPIAVPDLPQVEQIIVETTNRFRAQNALPALRREPHLREAAQKFADYLAASGAFAHTADGRQPADRALATGYHYCLVAENIASHQTSLGFETSDLAGQIVEGWENSPPHRANLLQPDMTDIGVGLAKSTGPVPKYLSVQMLGRPDSYRYQVKIDNVTHAAVTYSYSDRNYVIDSGMSTSHSLCTPREFTFRAGAATSNFKTQDGTNFRISQGTNGAPVVTMDQSAERGDGRKGSLQSVKAVKTAR